MRLIRSLSKISLIVFLVLLSFDAIPVFARGQEDVLSWETTKILALTAEKSKKSPVVDGVISENEYVNKTKYTVEAGLCIAGSDGTLVMQETANRFSSATETVMLSFDKDYVYVALDFSSPAVLNPYSHYHHNGVYSVTVTLNLDERNDFVSKVAGLRCTYYFSEGDRSLIDIVKTVVRNENGAFKIQEDCPRRDGEQAFYTLTDSKNEAIFEAKIAVGDILSCLGASERTTAEQALVGNCELAGAFSSQISLCSDMGSAYLCAAVGASAKDASPLSGSEESWHEYLVSQSGVSHSTAYAIEWIPAALLLNSSATETGDNSQSGNSATKPQSSSASAPFSSTSEKSTVSTTKKQTGSGDAPDSLGPQENLPNEDESIFENLPDDDLLPEDTIRVPISKEIEEKSPSSLGSFMTLFSGVLMLLSVALVAFVFFRKEKEEKNAENSKKKK